MEINEAFLPHTCTIIQRRKTGKIDEFGNPIHEEISLPPRACNFARKTIPTYYGMIETITCLLPPTTDAAVDDKIRTNTMGFAGEYWINSSIIAYGPDREPHHTKLELRSAVNSKDEKNVLIK